MLFLRGRPLQSYFCGGNAKSARCARAAWTCWVLLLTSHCKGSRLQSVSFNMNFCPTVHGTRISINELGQSVAVYVKMFVSSEGTSWHPTHHKCTALEQLQSRTKFENSAQILSPHHTNYVTNQYTRVRTKENTNTFTRTETKVYGRVPSLSITQHT